MAEKARTKNLRIRPHFKTHQSRKVGNWFREEGVRSITVSSLGMANYFAQAGWDDILVAFPVNIRQMKAITSLASLVKLSVLVDNKFAIECLTRVSGLTLNVFVELDTGSGRTGIYHEDLNSLSSIVHTLLKTKNLVFKGFYTHAGHSYQCRSTAEILQVFNQVTKSLSKIRQWGKMQFGEFEICMGDTPTCSLGENFEGIDTISPGNFVFYDCMQQIIGSCQPQQIAVSMACPVVSKNDSTQEVCIHGGAIHFSRDAIREGDKVIFGLLVRYNEDYSWTRPMDNCYIRALSQEHGMVKLSKEEFELVNIGDVLGILPVHSCLTAEAMGSYLSISGESIDHYAQKNRG